MELDNVNIDAKSQFDQQMFHIDEHDNAAANEVNVSITELSKKKKRKLQI